MNANKQSKHLKYNTKNRISSILVDNFYKCVNNLISNIKFESIIDLGCGEGHLLNSLNPYLKHKHCVAIDFDHNEIKDAKNNLPNCEVLQASIYKVPFEDKQFDLVICTEVLEHLENPDLAISEINRISNKYILLSVPREPLWRVLNMMRLSYLNKLGNTPGHLNHWSSKSFKKYVSKNFNIISVYKPIPWTIILAEKK